MSKTNWKTPRAFEKQPIEKLSFKMPKDISVLKIETWNKKMFIVFM